MPTRQRPDDQLDERERWVRHEAHLVSYRLLGSLIALLMLAALVVVPAVTGTRELSLDSVLEVLGNLVVTSAVLPSCVVAWRDTDLADDDDAETGLAPDRDRVSDEVR